MSKEKWGPSRDMTTRDHGKSSRSFSTRTPECLSNVRVPTRMAGEGLSLRPRSKHFHSWRTLARCGRLRRRHRLDLRQREFLGWRSLAGTCGGLHLSPQYL